MDFEVNEKVYIWGAEGWNEDRFEEHKRDGKLRSKNTADTEVYDKKKKKKWDQ